MAADEIKGDAGDPDNDRREKYEVEYLAALAGVTHDQARALIREHGHDRVVLVGEAIKLKRRGDISVGERASR